MWDLSMKLDVKACTCTNVACTNVYCDLLNVFDYFLFIKACKNQKAITLLKYVVNAFYWPIVYKIKKRPTCNTTWSRFEDLSN